MSPRTRWLIAFGWIAVAILTCFAADASSFRNWLYLSTVALVPPIALYGLASDGRSTRTIADIMHGGRS